MANTQAMCSSFKSQLMLGQHALGDGTGVPARTISTPDVVKAALYFASATFNASTTAYSATGEVGNSGTYAAGGATITMATPPSTDGTAGIFTPSASIVHTSFTAASFDCVLFYNSSQSNKAISVHTFGTTSIVAGTFTLTMPAHAAATALIAIT
mgnify:CR=1 FL=1